MPQTTIYIKEEDLPVFERAKQIAGEESLSSVIAQAVRQFVTTHETREKGYEEIKLLVGREDMERTKRFVGRFLAEEEVYVGKTNDRRDRRWKLTAYETAKGKIVIFAKYITLWQHEMSHSHMLIFNSLEDLQRDAKPGKIFDEHDDYAEIPFPGSLLDAIEEALGRDPGEWLDI